MMRGRNGDTTIPSFAPDDKWNENQEINMNIKLTNFEAAELIREHFHSKGLHPNVEITSLEIEPVPSTTSPSENKKTIELLPFLGAVIVARDDRFAGGSRKINAIKAIRAAADRQGLRVGLAEAKAFVEHWIG